MCCRSQSSGSRKRSHLQIVESNIRRATMTGGDVPKCKNISRLDPAAANQLFKQHLTPNTIQQLTEVDSHKQQINFRVSFKSISTNYVSTQSMEYLRRSRGLNSMLNTTRGRERERGSQEPFVPAKLRLIPARSLLSSPVAV